MKLPQSVILLSVAPETLRPVSDRYRPSDPEHIGDLAVLVSALRGRAGAVL
jgi:hypothetical protein